MAEKHYVDPKDQTIAAVGAPTHSELASMYRDAKKETLKPWMQEDERQAAMEKERGKVITNLRQSALRIGIYLSLPVVLGILLGQLAFFRANPGINEADAMVLAFLLLFLLAMWAILTFNLLRKVGEMFREHTLRSLPIALTTLLSLIFLIRPAMRFSNVLIGGIVGNAIELISLVVAGVIISVITIFIWTSPRTSGLVKILVLVLFFGLSVAAAYLV